MFAIFGSPPPAPWGPARRGGGLWAPPESYFLGGVRGQCNYNGPWEVYSRVPQAQMLWFTSHAHSQAATQRTRSRPHRRRWRRPPPMQCTHAAPHPPHSAAHQTHTTALPPTPHAAALAVPAHARRPPPHFKTAIIRTLCWRRPGGHGSRTRRSSWYSRRAPCTCGSWSHWRGRLSKWCGRRRGSPGPV